MSKLFQTHCPFCAVGCSLKLAVGPRNKIKGFEPDYYSPVNHGSLCPRGVTAYQQIEHKERLKDPTINDSRERRVSSWEAALDLVKQSLTRLIRTHGNNSVAMLSGARITNEEAYLFVKLARLAIRTPNIDSTNRLSVMPAQIAYKRAFGVFGAAGSISDIGLADSLLIVGSNIVACHPVAANYLLDAKENGATIICIDPRSTPTTQLADMHLRINPGTDIALLNGLLCLIIEQGLIDTSFISKRTLGFETIRNHVRKYTPEVVSKITGVGESRIVKAAISFGKSTNAMILHGRGIEQSVNATMKVTACINLLLALGKFGKPGCGLMCMIGQCNGHGCLDMGLSTELLPGQRQSTDATSVEVIARMWRVPSSTIPNRGRTAIEIFDGILNEEVKGLYILAANPAISMPDSNKIKEALQKLEFLVVQDIFPTQTAEYAHVILPGSVWSEKDGTITNMEGRCLRFRKAIDPPGNAKPDWQILTMLGDKFSPGFFNYEESGQIFEEIQMVTWNSYRDYSGISLERIQRDGGAFVPSGDMQGIRLFPTNFFTETGRAVFHSVDFEPSQIHQTVLVTYKDSLHFGTGTQTFRMSSLLALDQREDVTAEVSASVKRNLDLEEGQLIRLSDDERFIDLKASINEQLPSDMVAVPFNGSLSLCLNTITDWSLDPDSKTPYYKMGFVEVKKL